MNAATPLFYETGCEVAYPVAEGVANLVLTLVNNLFGLVFLLIQMIPNIGKNCYLSQGIRLTKDSKDIFLYDKQNAVLFTDEKCGNQRQKLHTSSAVSV